VSQNMVQNNESQRDIFQHSQKSQTVIHHVKNISKDLRIRTQELKAHYKSHFVQSSDKVSLKYFIIIIVNWVIFLLNANLRRKVTN
jgi:hypothetical protein